MDYRDIEVFLSVAQTRNISQSAKQLFLPQSTLSSRIKDLEQSLGCTLFIRHRGVRSVQLTPQGELFFDIAKEWKNLHERTEAFLNGQQQLLRVSCIDSVYTSALHSFITTFQKQNPAIKLSFKIQDSTEIYSALDRRQIDCGFVSYHADYETITPVFLYAQNYYIVRYGVCAQGTPYIDSSTLDPQAEVEMDGGNSAELARWRTAVFGQSAQAQTNVNSIAPLIQYLKELNGWALLSCALEDYPELQKYRFTPEIADRKVYYLKPAQNYGFDNARAVFEQALFSAFPDWKHEV